ncbi:Ras family protein [Trichomonas vaginalis G3]|uniref:Ras family protein n=1 Tax=Trichomonas vaginalis (strain ATCC PRA-98 / G3) TaxID=412133 RepID=A2EI68_TRIV3|nr:retrograde vesicle-mediated transport, Golgi to ER [Trichomonas vaginalis G3]EAY07628.1 Ras family protein [Trichomonas vaginalis G3]KAI5500524.1 retrograde vesicle-mediated transport, Golgi to ER [Trichomonas vaginalis G3]|eukprot:XP_001319851.1 Ras family protein [Trichomonas vaginalis G3]
MSAAKRKEDLPEYKVVMLGDSNVGKTSIIHRFIEKSFDHDYEPTVGASFLTKVMKVDTDKLVLNIWDTAGQERYKSLISTYARNAHAAILVYDVMNPDTFTNVEKWRDELLKYTKNDILLYLVANKIDLGFVVQNSEGLKWAKDNKCIFHQTSAFSGQGVNDLFSLVAGHLHAVNPHMEQSSIPDLVLKEKNKDESKSHCC